jgi:hypothetical protein
MRYTGCEKIDEYENGDGLNTSNKTQFKWKNPVGGIVTKISWQEWTIRLTIFRPILTANTLMIVAGVDELYGTKCAAEVSELLRGRM